MVRTSHNAASAKLIGHIFGFFLGEAINDAGIVRVVGLDEVDHIVNHFLRPVGLWPYRVIEIVSVGCAAKELKVCPDPQDSGTIVPNTLGGRGGHCNQRDVREVHLENAKLRIIWPKVMPPLAAGREGGGGKLENVVSCEVSR